MEFLTPTDLEQLTDYKSAKKQIETLTQMGVPFSITLHGKPKVMKSVLEAFYLKEIPNRKKIAQTEPNFALLREFTQR